MFYLAIILISMTLISIVNCIFFVDIFGFTLLEIVLFVVISVIIVVIIDGILAFIVRWFLPKKWFLAESNAFVPSKKQTVFYEKLGVKKWKHKVPDLGGMTGFKKTKILDPKNNEFVGRYIVEINYGVIVHISNILGGFLIIFIYPTYAFNILLPVAFVNAVLHYMAYVTLRYNLPKLKTLYKYNQRRS